MYISGFEVRIISQERSGLKNKARTVMGLQRPHFRLKRSMGRSPGHSPAPLALSNSGPLAKKKPARMQIDAFPLLKHRTSLSTYTPLPDRTNFLAGTTFRNFAVHSE